MAPLHLLSQRVGQVLEDIELLGQHYVDEGQPPVCRLLSAQIALLSAKPAKEFPEILTSGATRLANICLIGRADRFFSELQRATYQMDEETIFFLNEISPSALQLVVQTEGTLRIRLQGKDMENYPSFVQQVTQYLEANING